MQNLKNIFLSILMLLIALPSYSQKVDFDRVVTPPEMGTRDLKEYLVQLAWLNSPENEALGSEKKIKLLELRKSKKEWANDAQLTFNLNETHLFPAPIDPDLPIITLYPQYNFSATFKLGTLLNVGHEIDIAKQRVKIAEADINQKKLQVRMETLKRYEEFEMNLETLKAATFAEEDAKQATILITDLFKADKAKFEDYLSASANYHTAVQKRIKANSDMNIARLMVEEMIGIPLNEAKKMRE